MATDREIAVVPACVVFREDGLLLFRCVGERTTWKARGGEKRVLTLRWSPLLLGSGRYIMSLALYERLDHPDDAAPVIHDILDRSFEFSVHGVAPLREGALLQPFTWSASDADLS
jgi:hypothetical protein